MNNFIAKKCDSSNDKKNENQTYNFVEWQSGSFRLEKIFVFQAKKEIKFWT